MLSLYALYVAVWLGAGVVESQFVLYNASSAFQTSNLTSACQSALVQQISCDTRLPDFLSLNSYSPNFVNTTVLSAICTSNCSQSLDSYVASVTSACGNTSQIFQGNSTLNVTTPALYTGLRLRYLYNQTCLTDKTSGKYCYDFFASQGVYGSINSSTQPMGDFNSTSPVVTAPTLGKVPTSFLCSSCVIQGAILGQQASVSGYSAAAAAIWHSIQSICNITYPVTPTPQLIPLPVSNMTSNTTTTKSNATCAFGSYVVTSRDTSVSISASKNVSTGAFQLLNGIFPTDSNLVNGTTVCLPPKCQVYQFQQNDTCLGVAYNLTSAGTWSGFVVANPDINPIPCNMVVGNYYCLNKPGPGYTPTMIQGAATSGSQNGAGGPSNATGVNQPASVTPSPTPPPVPYNTTSNCTITHQVVAGDSCYNLAVNYNTTVATIQALNPSIDQACDNLQPGQLLCVKSPNAVQPIKTNCTLTYTVKANDTCYIIANNYSLTITQLEALNPSINPDCTNLVIGQAYCVSTSNITSLANCTLQYVARANDTCDLIAGNNGITTAQFLYINPSINANCTNLMPGQTYCVANCLKKYSIKSGDTCTTIANNFTISVSTLQNLNTWANCSALIPGQIMCVANSTTAALGSCLRTYVAKSGDTCNAIAQSNGITTPQFQALNNNLNCSLLQPGTAYCTANATIPSGTCLKNYTCNSGDSCYSISQNNSITVAQFQSLNPAMNCSALQPGSKYCVANATIPSTCLKLYTCQSGDTCSAISQNNALTVAQFQSLNPNMNCNSLQPGTQYCVANGTIPIACTKNYTVQSGDTCYSISQSNGETVAQLQSLNPGLNCSTIQPGNVLCVSNATSSASSSSSKKAAIRGMKPTSMVTNLQRYM